MELSDARKYRKFTARQKTEIVLASLRGHKTMAELCREHDIADSLLRKWREQFLAAGAERLRQGKAERTEVDELRAPALSKLAARTGTQDDGGRGRGGTLAGMGVRDARRPFPRARRCRAVGSEWWRASLASAARRSTGGPRRPPAGQRRPLDETDRGGAGGRARANPTDGTRMVAALAGRELVLTDQPEHTHSIIRFPGSSGAAARRRSSPRRARSPTPPARRPAARAGGRGSRRRRAAP